MSLYTGSRYTAPSIMSDESSYGNTDTSSFATSATSSRYSRANSRYSRGQGSNKDVYPTTPEAPERLAKARVLYLGTAATHPSLKGQGLGLVARPVTERLPDDLKEVQAIDAWLFVLDNGVQIGYVTDEKFLVWIPHQNVHMVAAIKRRSVGNPAEFVPIDSPEAEEAHSPPIFTMVTQRSNGLMECHSFICTSDPAAMSLVKSCTYAHNRKEAWTKFPPSREVLLINVQEAHEDLDDDGFSVHDVEPSEYSFRTESTLRPILEETGAQVDIPDGFDTGREMKQRRRYQYRVRDDNERGFTDSSYSSRSSGFRSSGDYRSTSSRSRTGRGDRWHRDFDVEVIRPAGVLGQTPQQLAPWEVPMQPQARPNYHPVPIHGSAPIVVYGGSAAPPYSYDSRSRGYSYRR